MKKIHVFILILLCIPLYCEAYPGREQYPLLSDTELYMKTVSNCKNVDVSSWKHPVKKVFNKYKVKIDSVELCNEKKYPVFHVSPKYDPEGDTEEFYRGFYESLIKENGNFPFSIVDSVDEEIINVIFLGDKNISVTRELYRSND